MIENPIEMGGAEMKRKNRGHVRSDPLRINDFFASNGSFYHPFQRLSYQV